MSIRLKFCLVSCPLFQSLLSSSIMLPQCLILSLLQISIISLSRIYSILLCCHYGVALPQASKWFYFGSLLTTLEVIPSCCYPIREHWQPILSCSSKLTWSRIVKNFQTEPLSLVCPKHFNHLNI